MTSCFKSLKSLAIAMALMMPCVALAADGAGNRGITDSVVTTIVGGDGEGAADGTTMQLTNLKGGICRDSAGNIYYTDTNRILKQTGAAVSIFAGAVQLGKAGEGVKAVNARFSAPTLLTCDVANNIYVLDSGNARIRKIDTNLIVTTIAGNGTTVANSIADIGRMATDARLPNNIVGLAVNAAGDLFFADGFTNCIYKVAAADHRLALIAGDGTNAGARTGTNVLNAPVGFAIRSLALLGDGTLIYSTNNGVIRNLLADGTSNVIAGVLDTTVLVGDNSVPTDALYPDDGTKDALQLITPTVTASQVGGIDPGPLAVDGATIVFYDRTERRIRSFTVGGKIQTVFGEVGEKGQTLAFGFRGEGTKAAPNTPRLGVVVTAGPNGVLNTAAGGDDATDNATRPPRIFAGPNGTSDTTATGDDVQVVAAAASAADDQSTRNDDPRAQIISGTLCVGGGLVTFVDDGNAVIRQVTVGGNVNTIAGTTNAIRRTNVINANFHQKVSTSGAVPALGASIFSPSQVARDSAGNLFFDALDVQSNHNIYKFDAVAKTIAVVAGRVITNGFPSNVGDGGPAATAKLSGLGTQASVLADGTLIFADTLPNAAGNLTSSSSHTIRAVSPTGVLSTIAGIPNLAGSSIPDVDHTTVNAAGNPVNPITRVGQKATDVEFNGSYSVLATSTSDFVVADTLNSRVTVVAGGIITVDQGVATPAYLTALSSTVVVTAQVNNLAGTNLTRIDYTNPVVTTLNSPTVSLINIRGLASGTINGTAVVFVLGQANQLEVRDATTLAQFYTGGTNTSTLTGVGTATGLTSDGTSIFITSNTQQIFKLTPLDLTVFPAGGAVNAPTFTGAQFFPVAGRSFNNVTVNGFNLQADYEFTTFAPIISTAGGLIVGDDGANQYRKVTLGTTIPQSSATVLAGTGVERTGGADGGPATATSIGPVEGIAVDSTGAVYFSDQTDITVRKVSGGTVSLFAGIPGRSGSNQPNNVPATQSAFGFVLTPLASVAGLAVNAAGEVFIADQVNNIVRRVNADGTIVTVAGIDESLPGAGGEGSDALSARLNNPHKIAVDANGDLFILENPGSSLAVQGRLHVVTKNNIITTINGGGTDAVDYNPTASNEVEGYGSGLALDTAGKIYYSHIVSGGACLVARVAGGLTQAVVGDPDTGGYNGEGLPGNQTLLNLPKGLATDPTLGLVICDSQNNRIRAVANLAEATNTPPTAVIATTPDHLGQAPLKIHFDGSQSVDADGDIVSWEWDFGDGTKGNGPTVDHVYGVTGSYTVVLTVTDTQGNTSTANTVVFAAVAMVTSSTNGKGAFKVAFGPKATKPSDSFSLSVKNIDNLTNQVGKPAKVIIGSFSVDATVGGKGVKVTSKTVKLTIDLTKKTVTVSIKGVKLGTALAELGVKNENTVAPGKSVLIPVVINVNNGALVVGDKFLFFYKAKFNSGASGKFSQ